MSKRYCNRVNRLVTVQHLTTPEKKPVHPTVMRLRLSVLILAAALPIVIFAAFMIALFEGQQRQSVEDRLKQTALASLRLIDDRIATVQAALETLAISGNLGTHDYDAFGTKAQQLLNLRPDWYALTV